MEPANQAEFRVLFISAPEGATRRYRCFQPQEQLELNGIATGFRTFHDVRLLQDALDYDVFIFHRTPYHRLLGDVLELAHRRGKIALFETDDLIVEPDLVRYDGYYRGLPPETAQEYLRNVHLSLETLKQCDYVLTTTGYLARALQKHGKPTLVSRNAVSVELQRRSEEAYAMVEPRGGHLVVGYMSGSPTHNQDFQVVADALWHMLNQYPRLELQIVGPLELDERFSTLGERIRRVPFMPWQDLPREIRATHVNLAPLQIDNPFCQSKSELKYFEAGLLGVPTIASPTEAFQFAIRHGENGFLAGDTREWIACLELLINDPARRAAFGQAARHDVLQNYTAQVRGEQFTRTLRALVAGHQPSPGAPQSQEQVERRLSALLVDYADKADDFTQRLWKLASLQRGVHRGTRGSAGTGAAQANLNVLFVSGQDGGTRRYRCFQPQEQLELSGIATGFRTLDDVRLLQDALDYDVFIFHRTPYNRLLQDVLELAHRRGKAALFETDDLIFEPDLVQYDSYYRGLPPHKARQYVRDVRLNLETLKHCDYALTTTGYLARALQKHGKQVVISRNAVSVEFARLAEVANNAVQPPGDRVVIGYISGSASHNQDFQVAADALWHVLNQYPQVELRIVGPLDMGERFAAFGQRVQQTPFIPWENVPRAIRATHVNLAPLQVDNPFCQSKSELKYLEAGLLGVPTIASPTEAFQFAIRHGENGFLASDSREWIACLELLINDPARRVAVGQAARRDVLQNYTAQARGELFTRTLRALVADHQPSPGAPQSQEQVEQRLSGLLVHHLDKAHDFRLFIGGPIASRSDAALSVVSQFKDGATLQDPFERSLQQALQVVHRARRSPYAATVAWAKHLAKRLTGKVYRITIAGRTYRLIGELIGGQVYCQAFQAASPNLCGASILFATFGRINTPDVVFRLKESEDLVTRTVSSSLLRDNSFFSFVFDPLPDSAGKSMCFSIESPGATYGDAVGVWMDENGSIQDGLYRNEQPVPGCLASAIRYSEAK